MLQFYRDKIRAEVEGRSYVPPAPSASNSSSSKPPASAGSRSMRAASNSNNDSWDDWGKPSNVKVACPVISYTCNMVFCLADVPLKYQYQGISGSQYSDCTQLETVVSVTGKFCIWSTAHAACCDSGCLPICHVSSAPNFSTVIMHIHCLA